MFRLYGIEIVRLSFCGFQDVIKLCINRFLMFLERSRRSVISLIVYIWTEILRKFFPLIKSQAQICIDIFRRNQSVYEYGCTSRFYIAE